LNLLKTPGKSQAGEVLISQDVSISGHTPSGPHMLEDVNGDGYLEIGLGYSSDDYLDMKARIYSHQGELLKDYTLGSNSDSRGEPVTRLGDDILFACNAGYSMEPRGFTRLDYATGEQVWHYDLGPRYTGYSIDDINEDGVVELSYNSFTPHNGASGNGTTDGDCYHVVIDENGNNVLTQVYGEGDADGRLSNHFYQPTDASGFDILSFKHYGNTYYQGSSKILLYDTEGTLQHSYTGYDDAYWEYGWADLDDDGTKEVVASNTDRNNNHGLYIFDETLTPQSSVSLESSFLVQAIADVDGDGIPDILTAGGNQVKVYDGQLQELYDLHLSSDQVVRDVIVSDNDGNGLLDIVVLSDIGITVFEGGSGSTSTTLSGIVEDATTGEPIEGATVRLGDITDVTDAQGNYLLEDVPPGELTADFSGNPTSGTAPLSVEFTDQSTSNTQTVAADANGYINYTNRHVEILEGQDNTLNIALSPEVTEGGLRFVLTWDDDPDDLDSHLETPEIEGNQYHIYYSEQGDSITPPYAMLDLDDVNGYGPETITIYEIYPGTYHYYIYKYGGNQEITESNAQVKIYDNTGLVRTMDVPTTGEGRFWNVCQIDGSTQEITYINEIQSEIAGFPGKEAMPEKNKPYIDQRSSAGGEIDSWQWSFGDGTQSSEQNPIHTYSASGSYDVQLTVTDSLNETSILKEGYIQVSGDTLTPPTDLTAEITDSTNGLVQLNWNHQNEVEGFYEDFEDGVADHFVFQDDRFTVENGQLVMQGNSNNTWANAYYDLVYDDYTFEFKASRYASSNSLYFTYGAFIRSDGFWMDSQGNGYLIALTSGGSYSVWQVQDGSESSIISWTSSDFLNTGLEASNVITIDAYGSEFDLYFNGNYVNSFTHSAHASGYVTLTTYDTNEGENEIRWDYVQLTTGQQTGQLDRPARKERSSRTFDGDITHSEGGIENQQDIPPKGLIDGTGLTNNSTFRHFNIYRNGALIDSTAETSYLDELPQAGTFEYQVSAHYEEGESAKSNLESVTWENALGYQISGMLSYGNTDAGLSDDTVELSGTMSALVATSSTGSYLFEGVNGHVSVAPCKQDEVGEINGFDLLRMKNYLLGQTELSDCALQASDCNGDQSINGFDLLRLKNYLLMQPVDPPVATWGFLPQQYQYQPIDQDLSGQDFKAYLHGDVNLSWGEISNPSQKKARNASRQFIEFGEMYEDVDGKLHLPVITTERLDLALIDWEISFDPNILEFQTIEGSFIKPGDYQVRDGKLQVVWLYNGTQHHITPDAAIGELVFTPRQTHLDTRIAFSSDNYMANQDERVYETRYPDIHLINTPTGITREEMRKDRTRLLDNYPNPFTSNTWIGYYLKQRSNVRIRIYSVQGQLMKVFKQDDQPAGFHQIRWDATDQNGAILPSGIYIYQLSFDRGTLVKRMLISR